MQAPPPTALSFFPPPYRITDKPSPTKRARLASSESESASASPSRAPSSASSDTADLLKERETTLVRLLDFWSGLERYNRPIREDDIWDFATMECIKDRRVLRDWKMAHPEIACEEDDDDTDSTDDADTNAPGPEEIHLVRKIPPVREMDPADAKDLKEFLEAENKRRAQYGTELDEDEGSSSPSDQRTPSRMNNTRFSARPKRLSAKRPSYSEQHLDEQSEFSSADITPHRSTVAPRPNDDPDSEDELASWTLGEAGMTYIAPKKKQVIEVNDDSDCPELPPTSTSPPPTSSPLPSSSTGSTSSPSHASTSRHFRRSIPETPRLDLAKLVGRKDRPFRSKANDSLKTPGGSNWIVPRAITPPSPRTPSSSVPHSPTKQILAGPGLSPSKKRKRIVSGAENGDAGLFDRKVSSLSSQEGEQANHAAVSPSVRAMKKPSLPSGRPEIASKREVISNLKNRQPISRIRSRSPIPEHSESYSDAESYPSSSESPMPRLQQPRQQSRAPSSFNSHTLGCPASLPVYTPPNSSLTSNSCQIHALRCPTPAPGPSYHKQDSGARAATQNPDLHLIQHAFQQLSTLMVGVLAAGQAAPLLATDQRQSTPFIPHSQVHPYSDQHHHPQLGSNELTQHPLCTCTSLCLSRVREREQEFEASNKSDRVIPVRKGNLSCNGKSHERRKSLVKRSRSRGRQVSFQIENSEVEHTRKARSSSRGARAEGMVRDESEEDSPGANARRGSWSELTARDSMGKWKGKEKVVVKKEIEVLEISSESEDERGIDKVRRREEAALRAQTPGPPSSNENEAGPSRSRARKSFVRSGG